MKRRSFKSGGAFVNELGVEVICNDSVVALIISK